VAAWATCTAEWGCNPTLRYVSGEGRSSSAPCLLLRMVLLQWRQMRTRTKKIVMILATTVVVGGLALSVGLLGAQQAGVFAVPPVSQGYFAKADGTPGRENIFNDMSVGRTSPSLAIDRNGRPHIAYLQSPGPKIMYSFWNGTAWVTPQQIDTAPNSVARPSLAVDSQGRPHVVWVEEQTPGNHDVYYRYWDGSKWRGAVDQIEDNVSNNSDYSASATLSIDAQDKPHITWREELSAGGFEVRHALFDGATWTGYSGSIDLVFASNAPYLGIVHGVVSPSGVTHVAWEQTGFENAFDIRYMYWNGTAWTGRRGPQPDDVSRSTTESRVPKVALGANDKTAVVWYEGQLGDARIAVGQWNGQNWSGFTDPRFDKLSVHTYNYEPMAAWDTVGRLGVAFMSVDPSLGAANMYFARWSGTAWRGLVGAAFDNVSEATDVSWPTIALGKDNQPRFIWIAQKVFPPPTEPPQIYFTQWLIPGRPI
jgi:hypothetical protein